MINETWFISTYVGASVVFSIAAGIFVAWRQRRGRVDEAGKGVITFNYARASSDLARCLLGIDLEGAVLQIIGGDGEYICLNGKKLKEVISKWISLGARVEYTLVYPSAEAQRLFQEFASSQNPEKFKLHIVESPPGKFEKYRTFHPSLISFADGAHAMWVEGYHPIKSAIAEDVTFVKRKEMAISKTRQQQFARFKKDIEEMNLPSKVALDRVVA